MPATIELDRLAREESYLQHGSSFVDRLRTRLVEREILKRLRARALSGCWILAADTTPRTCKPSGIALAEGVGVEFRVSEESRSHPLLRFLDSSVEEALPELAAETFDVVLCISLLEHLWDPVQALSHCHRVLKPGGRLLVNVPTWYAKPVLEMSAFKFGTSPAVDMDEHKMYYSKRDLWPLLVRAGFKPCRIRLEYRKLRMILFATAIKQ